MIISKAKLDIAIAKAGLTVRQVIEKTGLSSASVASHFKDGKRSSRPKTVGKIAKALDCQIEDLIIMDE